MFHLMNMTFLYGAMVLVLLCAIAFAVTGCKVGYPFQGPGYARQSGVTHPDAGSQVVVAITQGEVASGSSDPFFEQLRLVMDGLSRQDGLIGFSVRKELIGSRVWTLSVWVDDASLNRFLASPEHRSAAANGGIPRQTVIWAYTDWPKEAIPLTWSEAERLLREQNPTDP